jgi:hypothetical protein
MRRSVLVAVAVACLALAACADDAPKGAATVTSSSTTPSSTTSAPTTTTATTTAKATPRTTAPKPSTTSKKPSSSALRTSLKGDPNDAFAFAPLSDPGNVTVEGNVSSFKAWSTSKVLIVAAFLDTVCDGDPAKATAQQKRWITAALTASDMNAVIALRDAIPGSPGAAINRVLRSIGDTRTVAPDTSQGGMQWTIREQVRFMAALASGRVVSKASSSYLLSVMHPIPAHQWGLGTIGASAFKGGWLRAETVTRQMGIVDGYAVAIITQAQGPAVVQTDGDAAHVQQMNYLANVLDRRLALEGRRGPP